MSSMESYKRSSLLDKIVAIDHIYIPYPIPDDDVLWFW